MIDYMNGHLRIHLPFEVVGIKPSFNEETKPIRAISAEMKDCGASNPLIYFLMNQEEKVLIGFWPHKIACSMIFNDNHIRTGLELSLRAGNQLFLTVGGIHLASSAFIKSRLRLR
jgi:hypothetical protein